jgi:copper oxidase (laccase) domain-containing protein
VRLGPAEVVFTDRSDGDQRVGPQPWTRLRQVHGSRVVVVTEPGGMTGEEADAAVTTVRGAHLAILTADCAPSASHIEAALGPCIHPECYEFGASDLSTIAAMLGHSVRGRTAAGKPALNLPAGVRGALTQAGVVLVSVDERCTSCTAELYSHRARGEEERQAMVVWMP